MLTWAHHVPVQAPTARNKVVVVCKRHEEFSTVLRRAPARPRCTIRCAAPLNVEGASASESGKEPRPGDRRTASPSATGTVGDAIEIATSLFPFWVGGGALLAALYPPSFTWFQPRFIVFVLAFIMAGMGLTLTYQDFAIVLSRPRTVVLGVLAQYSIMPFLGYALTRILALPPDLAVGVILVAVCPGGAASNIVCLIGKADVALSVVLTLCSTMLAVFAIPVLMKLLAGTIVPISPLPLMISTSQVVVAPLIAGFALKRLAPTLVGRVSMLLPLVSALGVTLVCGSIVSRSAGSQLGAVGPVVLLALTLLHGLGGLLGFLLARVVPIPVKSARTISIEVMMQNSSLAVTLAVSHFASPLSAVPGAISATMHSVMGSMLAAFWRWRDNKRISHVHEE